MRKALIVLTACLLMLTVSQGRVEAAPAQRVAAQPTSLAKAKKKTKPKELKIMFTDGAPIHADADWQSSLVGTAKCGTLLTYQGKNNGEWYLVQFGKKKGWVSGWYSTFDTSQPYCVATFAEAYPPAPTPAPVQTNADVTDNGATSDTTVATDTSSDTTVSTSGSGYTESDTTDSSSAGDGSWYSGVIADAAATYGASFDELWAIFGCETGYVYDLDEMSSAGAYGPFQFLEDTYYWMAGPGMSGYGGEWQDATDQAYVAAWAFANGYASHWDCYYIVG